MPILDQTTQRRKAFVHASREVVRRMEMAIAESDDRIAGARQLIADSRQTIARRSVDAEWDPPAEAQAPDVSTVFEECGARIDRAFALIAISEDLIRTARQLIELTRSRTSSRERETVQP